MIAQIKSGSQFAGLVNYANDIAKKGTVIVASEGVCTSSNESITASFQTQAKMRPGLKKFVGHISLSFAPQDTPRLTDAFMAEIAKEYLRRMGITDTQYVVFRHKDQPHGHVHIVYNRVRNDGSALTGDANFRKSIAVTKALTREYGLTFGKGKKNVRRERLRGKDAVKYRLYDAIREAIKYNHDWQSLRLALEAKGIRMEVVQRAGGSGRTGIIFTYGNMTFSGGQIDRSLTYNRINHAMITIREADATDNSMPSQGRPVSSPFIKLAAVHFIANDGNLSFGNQEFLPEDICKQGGYTHKGCPAGYVKGEACPEDGSYVKDCIDPDTWCKNNGYEVTGCQVPQYPQGACPYGSGYYKSCETDNIRACKELGYSLTCEAGKVGDTNQSCPYNESYKKCVCNPCGGYDYTASEANAQGYTPGEVCNSCGTMKYKRSANACDGFKECTVDMSSAYQGNAFYTEMYGCNIHRLVQVDSVFTCGNP